MPPKSSTAPIARRALIATGTAALLSGCAGSLLGNAVTAARLVVSGAPEAPISKEYVANLPYASIGAKIGRGQRSLLVLGRYDGVDRHWISSNRAALVTRNGRLTRVVGVGQLRDTWGIEDDPVAAATFAFDGVHVRSVDLGPDLYFGLNVESTFEVVGRQTIAILGEPHDTLVVREHNIARAMRWRFDNEFWLDFATGYVWRSVQHIGPDVPAVEIEVFKRDA